MSLSEIMSLSELMDERAKLIKKKKKKMAELNGDIHKVEQAIALEKARIARGGDVGFTLRSDRL